MSKEPRFKPLSIEELTPDQKRLYDSLSSSPRHTVGGPYIPLMYCPDLAEHFKQLGDYVRFEGVHSTKLKELVVLLCARHHSVQYMFGVHRKMSAEAGVDPAVTDAIAHGRRPAGLSADENAAYDLTSELLKFGRVGDAAFAAALNCFGQRGVIELVTFVGYYSTLAIILNTARIPAPAGIEPLPQL